MTVRLKRKKRFGKVGFVLKEKMSVGASTDGGDTKHDD